MQEASIQGLWFIVILILGYYAFKWLARIFLPFLMQKAVRNFEKKPESNKDIRTLQIMLEKEKQLLISSQDRQKKAIIMWVNMLILKRLMTNELPGLIKIEFSL